MKQHKRFNVTESPAKSPGCDFITKSPVGPFVDTGYDVQFEEGRRGNRVYLSKDTLRELAEEAGLFEDTNRDKDIEKSYRNGYSDAVKENLSGNIDSLHSLLSDFSNRFGVGATVDQVDE